MKKVKLQDNFGAIWLADENYKERIAFMVYSQDNNKGMLVMNHSKKGFINMNGQKAYTFTKV